MLSEIIEANAVCDYRPTFLTRLKLLFGWKMRVFTKTMIRGEFAGPTDMWIRIYRGDPDNPEHRK